MGLDLVGVLRCLVGFARAESSRRLLIKPIQRCLKYPLLLQQIIELTDGDHPDYFNLQRARANMVAVADAINEVRS